jgi:mannosyl-3-phosphoglycerate phosphatase
MAKPSIPVIVFVDIDSAPAPRPDDADRLAAALESLAADRITLVFCTHRTRAEVESVRQSLGVFHPFICENGAAIFVPGRYFGHDLEHARNVGGYQAIEFAAPYDRVVDTLHRLADRVSVEVLGFSDMSVEDVARECGVSLLDGRLAKLREYGEPFRLLAPNPVDERRLLKALYNAGLTCIRRGAFHHASNVQSTNAAVATLTSLYRVALGSIVTVGLWAGGPATGMVDLRIDWTGSETTAPEGSVAWLERIVQQVDRVRDARLLWPQARHAR